MAETTSKPKHKRLPKSQRIHNRRVKQAARKAGTDTGQPASALRP